MSDAIVCAARARGRPAPMHVRNQAPVTLMAVVVATGIAADGDREILGCDIGDSGDEIGAAAR